MKPSFNGELRVRSGKKTYVLRPSFAALYGIEREPAKALHYLCDTPPLLQHQTLKEAAALVLEGIAPFSWADVYRLATGTLGIARESFWQMTPQELMLSYEGYCQAHGIESHESTTPPSKQEIEKLMEQFPD